MKKTLQEKYSDIKSINITFNNNRIIYNEKEYTENEWFLKINSFRKIDKNGIQLQNQQIKELPSTIYKFFCENVRKTSKLGLIFTQILFLIISLISFSPAFFLQTSANFAIFAKMSIFMGIIYFIIALVLFIKTILGEKMYLRYRRGQKRFSLISKKEYEDMIESFKIAMINEYYCFGGLYGNFNGEEISLREFKIDDVDELYNEFNNPNVFKYLLGNEFVTKQNAYDFIVPCIKEYQNNLVFKLALTVNGHVIGYIGISKSDYSEKTCQIIYAIGEKYWHHEYVLKGLSLYIPYLKEKGIEIIYCGHVKENVNSGRVMQKAGFIRCEERDTTMLIHGVEREIVGYIMNNKKETEELETNIE